MANSDPIEDEAEDTVNLQDATATAIEAVLSLALFTWSPLHLRTVLRGYIEDLTELNDLDGPDVADVEEGTIQ